MHTVINFVQEKKLVLSKCLQYLILKKNTGLMFFVKDNTCIDVPAANLSIF